MIRALVLVCFLLWPPGAWAQTGADEQARLEQAFDEIVFGAAHAVPRDIVLRIEGPVVFLPKGRFSEANLAVLETHAAELTALTGFPVRMERGERIDPGERPFWIYAVSRALVPAVVDRRWIAPSLRAVMARALCSFVTRGDHRIKEAVIVIKRNLDPATINHCLIEETSQALGAIDDTGLLDPSGFNDLGGLVARLQPADRVILRALFAEEVNAGMTRAAVLAILPDLIERARLRETP